MTETQRVENVARDKQQLVLFSAFAYGLAWTCFGLLGLSRSGLGWLPYDLSIPLMIVAGSFAPSLAALVTLRITERRWPSLNGLTLQSAVVAAIATPLLIGTTFAVIPAIILTTGPWSALQWGSLLSVSVYSVSTIIGGPLGEEPGWRGFALPRFQRLLGPASGSIALGVLWAAWHLPLFWTKAWTSSTFPSYVLMVTGLSLSMTFLFNAS
ncbi:MAG: CPBP family intramembrane metalloprotease, partial [Acidobacteria bacterium]|nr:CPBP family intramembrane metalloprotease [Acidobacteriota bacterium]